jgi:hypothetical protein
LRAANRRNVTAGATTDDDEVVLFNQGARIVVPCLGRNNR